MKGDFKGDFTRDTFNRKKHFARVLMQQGRVQLDADWNEQTDILLHYMRTLAADIIGPYGGPIDDCGFGIVDTSKELSEEEEKRLLECLGAEAYDAGNLITSDPIIGKGRYYVDGILCENEMCIYYSSQYPGLKLQCNVDGGCRYLVYLDVWERQVTYLEDDYIREVALGGPDTATRSKVEWLVRMESLGTQTDDNCDSIIKDWSNWVDRWQSKNRGRLKAMAKASADNTEPCTIQPEAKYRRAENQLYRVEVHRPGHALGINNSNKWTAATFKWSRDNGSVVFPIQTLAGETAILENLGRDSNSTLAPGNWVELINNGLVRAGKAGPLVMVDSVNLDEMTVTFKDYPSSNKEDNYDYSKKCPGYGENNQSYTFMRRWDHDTEDTEGCGAMIIKEGSEDWIPLEDGVQIQFQASEPGKDPNKYCTGDYWLIPARTATGDVEWPGPVDHPDALPPNGIEHHYAPLAIIKLQSNEIVREADCRCRFDSLCSLEKVILLKEIVLNDPLIEIEGEDPIPTGGTIYLNMRTPMNAEIILSTPDENIIQFTPPNITIGKENDHEIFKFNIINPANIEKDRIVTIVANFYGTKRFAFLKLHKKMNV
jgi:hypothetical protein